jgi:hypothetical protein
VRRFALPLRRQVLVEHPGRFDDVIVDGNENQIIGAHGIPPGIASKI